MQSFGRPAAISAFEKQWRNTHNPVAHRYDPAHK
jgi:hypothetical protein